MAPDYVARAKDHGDHAPNAGLNYDQGSGCEHAVLCPRYLGLGLVFARSFARIHRQNLVSDGVLPLFASAHLELASVKRIRLDYTTRRGDEINVLVTAGSVEQSVTLLCDLTEYESAVLEAGGSWRMLR